MAAKVETDEVYRDARSAVGDFKFDQAVATVFDDMVTRSVPFYVEIQRMIAEMARDFATPGSNVYDLGCSTGTTLHHCIAASTPASASSASTTPPRCSTSAAAS